MKKTQLIEYEHFDAIEKLNSNERKLLNRANIAATKAYADYSKFAVGAALELSNGRMYESNNQENASYPIGICAERTLLSYVVANFPDDKILRLVIFSPNAKNILSPCGLCRQSILEYEIRQNYPIQILLSGDNEFMKFESVKMLLPFYFDSDSLPK